MALQLGALRKALTAAGTPTDLADSASEELAGYETRFSGLEGKLTGLEILIERLSGQVAILRTMVVGIYAVLIPAAILLVRIAFKTGSLG